ncbi:MAG: leucine-rich repeat domain-containing protein [Muribaculum sp.]|nr:leucine-rich repeat domain-containing protein [Muribaculum sp.]
MTREAEFEIPGGSLYYERQELPDGKGGICITRMQGNAGEVDIPECIESCPVVSIARKAFLSRKNLRRLTIPASVTEVGDWAFAYCDSLHTVVFRAEEGPVFGKSVFMDCGSLRFLYVKKGDDTTAALLAAAVTTAGAPYLLNASEAGSEEWLGKWDARMLTVLHGADNEGYSKQVLCGEEDYGSTDLAAYESGRRKVKVRLLMLRLLYPKGLRDEHRREMEDYLRHLTKGCLHDETWQVVLAEHAEDAEYYHLFTQLGCVNEDNFEALLTDVGGDYPELKAYLMRYKEEKLGYTDFFAGLDL